MASTGVRDAAVSRALERVPSWVPEGERLDEAVALVEEDAWFASLPADEQWQAAPPREPVPGASVVADRSPLGVVRSALEVAEDATVLVRRARAQQWAAVAGAMDAAAAHPELYVSTGVVGSREAFAVAMRSARLDVATRLSVSEGEVESIWTDARLLQTRLPAVWAAFTAGRVDERNARTAAGIVGSIPVDRDVAVTAAGDARLDANLAVLGTQLTPGRFRMRARELRERLHPRSPQQRHDAAAAGRSFWIEPLDDGMAHVNLVTDAVSASKIGARVDGMARILADRARTATSGADSRTLPQVRSDLARDLLIDGVVDPVSETEDQPGRSGTPRTTVHLMLTLPALGLLAQFRDRLPETLRALVDTVPEQPATLDGVGPIPMTLARNLAGEATTFRRVLTDPWTGSIHDAESRTRRVGADLAEWIRYRDKTCRAPGCTRPAHACDLDHTIPWANDGPTSPINLGPLSPGHHTVKHDGAWRFEQLAPGIFRWISPTGRSTTVHPDDHLPY